MTLNCHKINPSFTDDWGLLLYNCVWKGLSPHCQNAYLLFENTLKMMDEVLRMQPEHERILCADYCFLFGELCHPHVSGSYSSLSLFRFLLSRLQWRHAPLLSVMSCIPKVLVEVKRVSENDAHIHTSWPKKPQ